MKTLLVAVLFALLAGTSQADTLWTYAGNTMGGYKEMAGGGLQPGGCQCALDGTFTLDAAGLPISWNFTDGTHTLTPANSTGGFREYTPGPGLGIFWSFSLMGSSVEFISYFYGSAGEATDESLLIGSTFSTFGYLEGNRGILSDPVSSPEPSTIALLALALIGLGMTTGSKTSRPIRA